MNDPHDWAGRYAGARRILLASDLSKKNKQCIMEFDDFCKLRSVSLARRTKYFHTLRQLATWLRTSDLTTVKRENIAKLFAEVNDGKIARRDGKKFCAETIDGLKAIVRTFYFTFLSDYKELRIDNSIKKELKRQKVANGISANDILNYEGMQQLIEAGKNVQKQALLAIAAVTGARPSEYLRMTVGDVLRDIGKFGYELQVHETKRQSGGEVLRFVDMPIFHHYLRRWLSKHPAKEDKNAPLWVCGYKGIGRDKQRELQPLTYPAALKAVREAFAASGLGKNFDNPYILRHSSISYFWCTMGYDIAKVAKRVGTSVEMIENVYGHLKKADIVSESARVFFGKEAPQPDGKTIFIDCPLCHLKNSKNDKFCSNCGAELNAEGYRKRQSIDDVMTHLFNDRDIQKILMRKLSQRPELAEQILRGGK